MEQKKCLHDFFAQHPRIAVALSGGTDSSYLLYQAKATGGLVHAYTVRSVFQIESELDDAKRLADDLDVPFTIIPIDILNDETIAQNGQDRCYYCKRAIFYRIIEEAKKDGISTIADGTNASDDITTRPGMRALAELGVCSPLRECGITKSDIRTAAKKAGLSASDKPAQSCLATRIPFGTPLCESNLRRIKAAETQIGCARVQSLPCTAIVARHCKDRGRRTGI